MLDDFNENDFSYLSFTNVDTNDCDVIDTNGAHVFTDVSCPGISHTVTSTIDRELEMNICEENLLLNNGLVNDENTETRNAVPNSNCIDKPDDPYEQLSTFSKENFKKIIFSHLNVNSLSTKFMEIHKSYSNVSLTYFSYLKLN